MNKTEKTLVKVDPSPDSLFERVVAILERARANVVRLVTFYVNVLGPRTRLEPPTQLRPSQATQLNGL
jgi:hypothetical protein